MLTDHELLAIRRLVETEYRFHRDIPATLLKEVDALRAELKAVMEGPSPLLWIRRAIDIEREACAKIAAQVAEENEESVVSDRASVARDIADRIRARYNVGQVSKPSS